MPPLNASPSPRSLSAEELAAWLQRGDSPQVVDVREDQELAWARLPHPVVHLPLSRASEWMAELASRLDAERPVVVLCHAGVRSWQFACWLAQMEGYPDVWNLEGGMEAWSVRVDPSIPRY